MKNWKLIILALFLSYAAFAQQAKVQVSADTNAILIGEPVQLNLEYQFPKDIQGLFPAFKDTISAQLEIINQSAVDTVLNQETGITTLSQKVNITSFDTGYHVIPPLPFGLKKPGDSAYQILQSEPLLLSVFTVEVDTTKDIKPIVRPIGEPYTLGEFLPWISLVFAIGLLIFAIFYFYKRKKKNKPLFVKKQKPVLPAHEQALNDLEMLRLKKLWQQDRLKEYHSELTDIIRIYIERRFKIPAVEMVSFEILQALKQKAINDQAMGKLTATLELADMVKFAKSGATAIENDTSLNNCIDFVNETKAEAEKVTEVKKEDDHV